MLKKKLFITSIITSSLVFLSAFSVGLPAFAKTSGTLNVGLDDTYPPMEFKDTKNNTVGFDVDLAKEVGKRINKNVNFISTAWDGIFTALNSNKFDCIVSAVSITPERQKSLALTKPYLSNGQVIVVAANDKSIKKPEDLKGKTVGAQINTTSSDAATAFQKKVKFDLKTYDQVIMPFQDLKAGRLDAIVVDEVVAMDYCKKQPKDYKVSSAKLSNEPIGIACKKSNTALRDKIQVALDAIKKDGTLKKLSLKWFNKDLSTNIDKKYEAAK